MTVNEVNDTSATERFLLKALIISLLLHLVVFSVWREGQTQGWWRNMILPHWMQWAARALLPPIPKKSAVEVPPPTQLTFVEVDPALATPVPPKKPMFQGAQNTLAANREIKVPSIMPDLDGKQEKFLKTIEDAKPKPRPAPAVLPQPQPTPPQTASRRTEAPGDLATARPSTKPQEGKRDSEVNDQTQPEAPPVHERPRYSG